MNSNFCVFLLMSGVHLSFGLDSLTIKAMPHQTINYNDRVTLECVYTYDDGREAFAYFVGLEWMKNGSTIATANQLLEVNPASMVTINRSSDEKHVSSLFVLSAVNCSHIGNYSCVFTSKRSRSIPKPYVLKKHIFLDVKAVRQKPTISSEDGRTLYTENDVVAFTCIAITGRPPVYSKMKVTFTNGTTKPIQTASSVSSTQDSCIKQERLEATIKLTRNHKAIVCSVTEQLSSELPLSVNSIATGQSKKDQSKKATVVAVTVGFLVVFLVGIGGGLFAYKYKRSKKQQNIEDFDESDNENASRNSSSSSGEKGSRRKRSKRSKKSRK